MKIMMLGGGTNQLCAIKRILERGDEVIVSDYLDHSPGKALASKTALADTFSYEDTLVQAQKLKPHAVLTVGTDQPVLTAARVCETMALPTAVSSTTALHVTNKKYMKDIFMKHKIPSVEYKLIDATFKPGDAVDFHYPAVLKPVDSQGQRGIFKVYSSNDVSNRLLETLKYSKSKEALLERYYENQEVTVSGWVQDRKTYILTMTDRVTFSDESKLGVCVSHEHPSVHTPKYGDTAKDLTERIVQAFNIENGPIYFQFLVGSEGMLVNEIACRIGGAYEDQFIPRITGFDILDAQLDLALGQPVSVACLEGYDFRCNENCVSVQLFFARPGQVESVTEKEHMIAVDGVSDFRCHYQHHDVIPQTKNASARAGFGLMYADNEAEIRKSIGLFFDTLEIRSMTGDNLVLRGCRGNRDDEKR
jgi:biotin carboxylase